MIHVLYANIMPRLVSKIGIRSNATKMKCYILLKTCHCARGHAVFIPRIVKNPAQASLPSRKTEIGG